MRYAAVGGMIEKRREGRPSVVRHFNNRTLQGPVPTSARRTMKRANTKNKLPFLPVCSILGERNIFRKRETPMERELETIRLYYEDPYMKEFEAVVLDCIPDGKNYRIKLNRTAFYPEGGG